MSRERTEFLPFRSNPCELLALSYLDLPYFFALDPLLFPIMTTCDFRDGVVTALHSSSTCWAIAVNDYGAIVSTIFALATFASLFFLAYVLHRTLAPKTPPNAHRHNEKHKRKKSKYKNHGRGKGRVRTNNAQNSTKMEVDTPEKCEALPPLVEDEPVEPPSAPSSSVSFGNASVNGEGSHEPLRSRAASSSTLDSNSSSVESGRSTPTPAAANETNVSSTAMQVKPAAETNKSKGKVPSAQSRGANDSSRRLQNNIRRGKKPDAPVVPPRGSGPATPSRRWDALKPTGKATGTRLRNNNASNKHSWNNDTYSPRLKEMKSPPRDSPASYTPNSNVSTSHHQSLPMHHSASFPAVQNHNGNADNALSSSAAKPSDLYESSVFGNDRQQFSPNDTLPGFGGSPSLFSPGLNPDSPAWEDRRARTNSGGTPIRPPPGLESVQQRGVPFGCGSSDGGSSAPNSPYQTLPSVLDIGTPEPALTSPLLPPTNDTASFYPARFENVPTTLPFRPTPNCSPHVKENPFATSSDDEDEEKIAASLQELGGQMVGSILDF